MNQMQQDPQAVINAVKAASFDQITGLNQQINNLQQALNNQQTILENVIAIVCPDEKDVSVGDLLEKLKALVPQPKGDNPDE